MRETSNHLTVACLPVLQFGLDIGVNGLNADGGRAAAPVPLALSFAIALPIAFSIALPVSIALRIRRVVILAAIVGRVVVLAMVVLVRLRVRPIKSSKPIETMRVCVVHFPPPHCRGTGRLVQSSRVSSTTHVTALEQHDKYGADQSHKKIHF